MYNIYMTEFILLAVILLQFIYIIYSDIQNRKEREALEVKIMCKDLDDYKSATEDTPKDSPKDEEDPYIPIEEAGIERIIKAKDKS